MKLSHDIDMQLGWQGVEQPLPFLRILTWQGTEFRATETRSGSGLSIGLVPFHTRGSGRGKLEVTHAAVVPRVAFESESGTVRPGIFLGCLRRQTLSSLRFSRAFS